MTKREREDERRLYRALEALGFDGDEIETLRRASKTLHRWAEHECNGEIERDDETGQCYGVNPNGPYGLLRWRIPDRERGALARITAILKARPELWYYHQTDPRGAALYIGRASDLPAGSNLSSLYTRGVAVW